MIPDLPPPTAEAYDKARSFAFPVLSLCTAIKHGTPPPFWYSVRTKCPGPFGAIMNTSRSSLALIKS